MLHRDDADARGLLAMDTTRTAEQVQVTAWRAMSSVERAQLIAGAARAVRSLALTGLRWRHPDASERAIVARFALLTLGRPLAHRVYPDLIEDVEPRPRD